MKINNPYKIAKQKKLQKEVIEGLSKATQYMNSRRSKSYFTFYCGIEQYNQLPNWMKNEK